MSLSTSTYHYNLFTVMAELFDEMEQENRANSSRLSTSRNLLAGGVGGMFAWLTSHPFDTVKVRLQSMSSTIKPGQKLPYTGPIDCLQKLIREGGVRSLFRGVSLPLMIAVPSNALMFYSLALGKRLQLKDVGKEPTFLQHLNAGMFCGFAIAIPTCPAERVKCILQTQLMQLTNKSQKKGPLRIIRTIYKQEGFKGFYKGIFVHWTMNMIGLGAWFLTYEALLKSLRPRDSTRDEVSMASIVFSSAVSGVVLWSLIFPFDLIKTRYQISPVGKYRGGRDVLREVLKNEGPRGLFNGFASSLVRAPVFSVGIFVGYELSLKTMLKFFSA